MRTASLLLAFICAVLTGGCGDDSNTMEAKGPNDVGTKSEDLVPIRVSYYESLDEDRLRFTLAHCGGGYSADIDESDEEVRVSVLAPRPEDTRLDRADQLILDCADQLTVALEEPLGDRFVIDSRTDAAISQVLTDK